MSLEAMSAQSETLEISGLPPGTRKALDEIGRDSGRSGEEYARMLIEAEILSRQPFAKILAPIRQAFRESGMTDDELQEIVVKARAEIYREKQKNSQ